MVGANTKTTRNLASIVDQMTESIRHRGPDDGSAWCDLNAGVGLGHRRLSILDLSDNGRQPMQSNSGRWIVLFNGEIYAS